MEFNVGNYIILDSEKTLLIRVSLAKIIYILKYDQSFVVFKEVDAIQYVGDVFLIKLCSLVIRIMQVPSSCLFESR